MEASKIVPVERQGRPTTIPRWIVRFEGVSLEAVNVACDAHLSALSRHGCAGPVERDSYTLQIMVTNKEGRSYSIDFIPVTAISFSYLS